MKRSTLSLLISAAIFAVGLVLIWFLIVAPRFKPAAPTPVPTVPPPAKTEERHGALNLYLTAPVALPSGATGAEVTLVKAALVDGNGREASVFEGAQKVMLRPDAVEKTLSVLVPNRTWERLILEFSPAAEIPMADGTTIATVVERRRAVLSFHEDLPVSRSLALLARLPLAPALRKIGAVWAADIVPDPQAAESHVFGSFFLDARSVGALWMLPHARLSDVLKADLGLDIGVSLPGSKGFGPADQAPATGTPR